MRTLLQLYIPRGDLFYFSPNSRAKVKIGILTSGLYLLLTYPYNGGVKV